MSGEDIANKTILIKSVLQGDEVMLRSDEGYGKNVVSLAYRGRKRSKAELQDMFIKCFAFALRNYRCCEV